ncbi:MAG: response regulator [Desulfobacteraceae bacterium]|nr:response regulator [Desulfobacteraceae bacterium]
MKILVVDDELVSRKKMETILDKLGRCTGVATGAQALAVFSGAIEKGRGFGLVTLDISLPDMRGTEVLSRLREIEEENNVREDGKVKILMVTSHAEQETVLLSIVGGCDDYIIKPFSKETMDEKIRKIGL